jgi:hypothetical protein
MSFFNPASSIPACHLFKHLRLLSLFTLGSSILSMSSAQTYQTFDPPKSSLTMPSLINQEGQVAGVYDNGSRSLGFIRSAEGQFTTFPAPYPSSSLAVTGLNSQGTMVGSYTIPPVNRYTVDLPFVRKSNGSLTTIKIPKTCVEPPNCEGNFGLGINNAGTILGQYEDDNFHYVGFTLSSSGKLTAFNVPDESITETNYDTYPAASGINQSGAITGHYTSAASGTARGFLRAPDGKVTTFSVSGASSGGDYGTFPLGINDDGAITGYFTKGSDSCAGFVRSPGGEITTFAPSDLAAGLCFLMPASINHSGTIAGYYMDNVDVYHGFVRTAAGEFTSFEVPGANTQSDSYEGTYAVGINDAGVITGFWNDKDGDTHGFVRTP